MWDGFELAPSQRLASMTRAVHTRGNAFVITDRAKNYVILAQKITDAARFLRAREADAPSAASLYEAASGKIKRVHRRWEVTKVALERAPEALERERARQTYAHTHVLTPLFRTRVC